MIIPFSYNPCTDPRVLRPATNLATDEIEICVDLGRSRSIRSQYPRNDGRDASSDRLMFLREETATKRACALTRTRVFGDASNASHVACELAVEMSGSEYGASKIYIDQSLHQPGHAGNGPGSF
jgi:hypothetical protein